MASHHTSSKIDSLPSRTMPSRLINLLRGWPAPTLLPAALLQAASTSILRSPTTYVPALQYAPDEGPLALRQALAAFLTAFYARSVSVERICSTGGASQNLGVALAAFTDPVYTRAVWAVEPTYYLACRLFDDAGIKVRGVPDGATGVDIQELRKRMAEAEKEADGIDRPKYKPLPRTWPTKIYKHIIYVVPTFSNPSGRCMTLSARQDLVRLAREYDALIICDDVYDFLYWSVDNKTQSNTELHKAVIPRLVDVDATLDGGAERHGTDGFGNVMSNGSFSKIVGPGVRTGWAEATPKLAYALSQAGTSRSGGAASNLTGELVGHALASGGLETHIRETLLPAYEKRWRVMYNAIETHLTPLGVTMPFAKTTIGNLFDEHDGINEFHTLKEGREQEVVAGGYFTYIRLPHGISAGSLAQKAEVEEMLIVTPESMCRVPRRNIGEESVTNDHDEYVRLCFAWEDEDGLVEGVMRLATVLEKMIKGDTDNFSPKSGETTSRDVYG